MPYTLNRDKLPEATQWVEHRIQYLEARLQEGKENVSHHRQLLAAAQEGLDRIEQELRKLEIEQTHLNTPLA